MFGKIKVAKDRLITGILLICLVALVSWFHSPLVIWLFFGLIAVVAVSESLKLYKIYNTKPYTYTVIVWVLAYFLPNIATYLPLLVAIIFASVLAYKREFEIRNFLPILYPLTPMLFLLTLYNSQGINSLIWLVVIVASCDIGAYFVGKSIGKTPFSPSSPNKTVEGVVGGVAIASAMGGVVGLFISDFNFYSILITFFVAVSSVFGDLFESYLKREADVKDSGSILPGHGGVLDRVDGYLFASVVMYVLVIGLV